MSAAKFTLNLPKTDFPMRPDHAVSETALCAAWRDQDLRRPGAAPFVLLDGPPYANGHLHPGHVLNKSLKDAYARVMRMFGHDVEWVMGWDCHGLPVEWNVEKRLLAEGVSAPKADVMAFRAACRAEAQSWVDVQRAEFARFGFSAAPDAYLTMSARSETAVAQEFLSLVMAGRVYEKAKPVLWSPLEDTVMAGAEVEHKDMKQKDALVAFAAASGPLRDAGAAFAVWTTTPWTLPLNAGLAVSETLSYGLYAVGDRVLVLADDCASAMWARLGEGVRLHDVSLAEMRDAGATQPLPQGVDVPVVPSDHVRADAGTGVVHLAPAHGPEDYALGVKFGLSCEDRLTREARYADSVPLFAGLRVVSETGEQGEAVFAVLRTLKEAGTLLGTENVTVSSSRSWRSGGPLLFRTLPQWFLRLDDVLPVARDAAEQVTWMPESAARRFKTTLDGRPDWLLSRQRAWGVPLPLFLKKASNARDADRVLRDADVNARVLAAFAENGSDVWFAPDFARSVLGDRADDYEQVLDVLDVWFDSGCAKRLSGEGHDRVDLVVEGQDQHRGWFQSQMLVSCAADGHAPYRKVRAHGFVLDDKKEKLSKSKKNGVNVMDVAAQHGAEVLRLWAVTCASEEDVSLGEEALKFAKSERDVVRNALRFALANVGSDPQTVPYADLADRERWLLSELHALQERVMEAYAELDTGLAFRELRTFCAQTLSSFYYDGVKDTLYCDPLDAPQRRSVVTALDVVFRALASWAAPVMPFTADEAWSHRFGAPGVHAETFFVAPDAWSAFDGARWAELRALRTAWGVVSQAASKAGLPTGMGAVAVVPESWTDFAPSLLSDMLSVSQVRFAAQDLLTHVVCADPACPRCKKRQPLTDAGLCVRCADAESPGS